MNGRKTLTAVLLASSLGTPGCLPADTRPEPGRIYVTTDLPTDLRETLAEEGQLAFTTEDGWTVNLTRLFVSLGSLGFAGEGCNEYSEARYGRVLDMQQPGPQKLGQMWGLNGCLVSYSVYRASSDSVLGAGVTTKDRDLMQNALVPTSAETGVTTAQGMTLHVQGSAENSGTTVSFDWGFSDRLNWTDCQRRINGELETQLPLVGGETLGVNIVVEPRNLFLAVPDGSTALASTDAGATTAARAVSLMQLIADADQRNGNANGRVALDELSTMTVPSDLSALNLAEVIRQKAYPSVFQYGGDGQCVVRKEGRHGPGGGM